MEKMTAGDYTQKTLLEVYISLPTEEPEVCTEVCVQLPPDAPTTFDAVYKALPKLRKAPKTAFVEMIAELCLVTTQTVRMWIQGVQRPDALKQKLISEKLNIPVEVLFPAEQ